MALLVTAEYIGLIGAGAATVAVLTGFGKLLHLVWKAASTVTRIETALGLLKKDLEDVQTELTNHIPTRFDQLEDQIARLQLRFEEHELRDEHYWGIVTDFFKESEGE